MMAHAADFHEGQLRLSAFLRVMGKVPERPKRLQQNRQAPWSLTDQHDPARGTHFLLTKPAPAAEPVQDDSTDLPDDSMPEIESSGRIPAELRSVKANNESQSVSASSATKPLDIYAQKGSDVERLNVNPAKASSAVRQKTKVVYTAKKKQMKQPMGIRNVQERHTISDNCLVFVRASTEDGLPLPGNADVVSAGLMEELDPIQDTPLGRPPAQLNNVQVGSAVNSSNVSKHSRLVNMTKNDPQQPKRSRLRADRIFTSSNAHAPKRRYGGLRLPGPGSLCDGFEGHELLIPAPKEDRRVRQKEISVGMPKPGANVDESRGGLELASGLLPVSCPIEPKLPKSSGTPLNEYGSQLELVHPVETDFQKLRHDFLPLRLVVETTIRSQLSSITAPLREGDESDSSSLDEESNASFSRSGSEDLSRSSDSENSGLLSPGPDPGEEEMDYLGEAMYGMNNRDEEDFWSQYPGLD
ncbi:hypothetical protein PMIN04_010581 [Paraphaeosphaeria minitans]